MQYYNEISTNLELKIIYVTSKNAPIRVFIRAGFLPTLGWIPSLRKQNSVKCSAVPYGSPH